jgi:hypothetical protein
MSIATMDRTVDDAGVRESRGGSGSLSAEELRQIDAYWRAAYPKQAIRDILITHRQYVEEHGDDLPQTTGWRWGQESAASQPGTSTEGDNVCPPVVNNLTRLRPSRRDRFRAIALLQEQPAPWRERLPGGGVP